MILPLDLAGADTTRELLACAQRLGLESMVRVCDAAGLDAAVAMGAAAVVLGDIRCSIPNPSPHPHPHPHPNPNANPNPNPNDSKVTISGGGDAKAGGPRVAGGGKPVFKALNGRALLPILCTQATAVTLAPSPLAPSPLAPGPPAP